jgi:hypothetical protein
VRPPESAYDAPMRSRHVALAAALSAALVPGGASAGIDRPPPPPEFASLIEHGPLVAGRTATFTYRVQSDDYFRLTLTRKRSALVPLRTGSTPYRLVAGRPTWAATLPGRVLTTRVVRIRVRVGAAWAGRNVCLALEEKLEYGGVPDVFEKRSCARVRRA